MSEQKVSSSDVLIISFIGRLILSDPLHDLTIIFIKNKKKTTHTDTSNEKTKQKTKQPRGPLAILQIEKVKVTVENTELTMHEQIWFLCQC